MVIGTESMSFVKNITSGYYFIYSKHVSRPMKLSDLGERRIIDRIIPILKGFDKSKIKNFSAVDYGDDVAALEFADRYLVISTDMLTQSTHIPVEARAWQIGWYAISTNLSDIAAKGALPVGLMVSLGLPPDKDVSFVEELMKGMGDCAFQFNTSILGGDTKPNEFLTISVVALGIVKKEDFMPRRGGKKGDLIAVTGELGEGAMGYYANDMKLLLEPIPCIEEGRALSKTGAVTSSMDISDGLANSLYQQTKLNDLQYLIYLDHIPVSKKLKDFCKKEEKNWEDLAIQFGGDFELLVTIDPEKLDLAKKALDGIFAKLTVIGEVAEQHVQGRKAKNIIVREGKEEELKDLGYEHFRDSRLR
jgi:thiamine-monophosphate kinase